MASLPKQIFYSKAISFYPLFPPVVVSSQPLPSFQRTTRSNSEEQQQQQKQQKQSQCLIHDLVYCYDSHKERKKERENISKEQNNEMEEE
ncbi:hypothetical protein M0802_002301 [Mischocyttarus mexicanus]|nr:hypothetical protein M0802_002301 [Mischocyttarus mexicanus]